jgi:hypothetical protein
MGRPYPESVLYWKRHRPGWAVSRKERNPGWIACDRLDCRRATGTAGNGRSRLP